MDDASLSANRYALRSLIDRLESAESGNRGLDAEIAVAVMDAGDHWPETDGRVTTYNPDGGKRIVRAPAYTTSLDAALTLVPEGWNSGGIDWWKGADRKTHATAMVADEGGEEVVHCAVVATPALALCIAALRARLAVSEEEALSSAESVASQ